MRFLIVKERNSTKRINVDRIINIQSYGDKVRILYDIGGDCHSVEFEVRNGSAEHVADMIMNRILGDEKVIDIRDIDSEDLKFANALELAKKSGIIIA